MPSMASLPQRSQAWRLADCSTSALRRGLNEGLPPRAFRATLYPKVTEPICRLPLATLSSH